MTEVLSSQYYGDFSSCESTSLNLDPADNPPSPLPLVDNNRICATASMTVDCHDILLAQSFKAGGVEQDKSMVDTDGDRAQLSLLALLLAAFRRSGFTCRAPQEDIKMDIGWPTDVRHVAHVTFDRFNGFLGLPVEFEMEIPRRVPSASASVFGVSPESMQCSYDRKGNSVPLILLLLQKRLYHDGGLKAEGIFRINAENGQEEHLRAQLNKGIVPHDIDVHCLAGLIKAWFRELPIGVFDTLSPEQVMQCQTEEQCLDLVKLLPPTQAALLDWAVNLMADVVQEEEFNKMNARNIAMVFAPNMTQMSDPLTALMHAVQVMNFLKTLVLKTLRDREEAVVDCGSFPVRAKPPKGDGHGSVMNRPSFSLSNEMVSADDGHVRSSKGKVHSDTHTLEKTFLRGPIINEKEANIDSRGPWTTASEACVSIRPKRRSARGKTMRVSALKHPVNEDGCERAGASDAQAVSNKAQPVVNGLSGECRENLPRWDSEDKDSMQYCIVPEALSLKGKSQGEILVGRIDQQNEKVEAW